MSSAPSSNVGPSVAGDAGTHPPSSSPVPTAAGSNNNGNSGAAAASIAVFLFAKEKLLFRYPDTDPFTVDVATTGNTSGGGSGGTNEATTGSSNSGNGGGGAAGRGESTSTAASVHSSTSSSRDRHRRGNSSGRGTATGAGTLHPDNSAAAPTAAGGSSGGGNRLKKKSPHVHVTMAADLKDSTEATAAVSAGSTSGVAPQRGMRRPMSAYTLVNDSLSSTSSGTSLAPTTQGHHGGSSNVGGVMDGRRPSHVKSSSCGAIFAGPTTQVQNTSTGSTRQQTPSSAATSVAARGGKSSHSANSVPGTMQQQQQQSTGAATCVGIPTNVLMHLLRGVLNGCTTVNMVNCTFLVFPLMLALWTSPSPSLSRAADASSGSSDAFLSHTLDRQQRQPPPELQLQQQQVQQPRSATALLVVAMKQPDTDSGAIANFAQCFVNILLREEHRCHYVSTELDRMETLTNHWEVGGAAAVANAAADIRRQQSVSPHGSAHSHPLSPPRSAGWHGDGAHPGLRGSSASPPRRPSQADKSGSGGVDVAAATAAAQAEGSATADTARTHGDYDYLFAPPRAAVRGGRSAAEKKESLSNAPHRTSSHNGHATSAAPHRDASPPVGAAGSNGSRSTTFWAEPDNEADTDDGGGGRDGHRGTGGPSASSTRAASPSNGGDGGGLRRRGRMPTSSYPIATAATSLYQQLATYVRLASEVQQVAQCIDLWNRTSRVTDGAVGGGRGGDGRRLPRPCIREVPGAAVAAHVNGAGGGGASPSSSAALLAVGNGRARSGATGSTVRDPFRRFSNVGTCLQQQQWVTAAPGEVLETLPDAILVNQMLLLPMSNLTGQERLEQAQTMRSAYSRIHPCSVVTVEESQFTEELQRSYVEMMGRRYAKLIPLTTVYALLLALPSPRRAGSFYRSIELALLEAVQRRHARAAATAAAAAAGSSAANNNNSTASSMLNVGATDLTGAHASGAGSYLHPRGGTSRSSRDALDDESSSAVAAAAAATTAAGLDFLAMEIIDFLRVNGAISVASEMWVCFTHGEVTPVEYVEAAAQRRHRHRLRAERRRQRTLNSVGTGSDGTVPSHRNHYHHHHHHSGRSDRHQRFCTQAPEVEQAGDSEKDSVAPNNSSWVSSEATTAAMDDVIYGGTATSSQELFEEVKDMDTVPAALVLHMLERVVDAQHPQHPQPRVPTSASAASLNGVNGIKMLGSGLHYNATDAEALSNTTTANGMPTTPSTGATIPATSLAAAVNAGGGGGTGGGGAAQTPRSSETDTSVGRASYKAGRLPDNTCSGQARSTASSVQQQQQQAGHGPSSSLTTSGGALGSNACAAGAPSSPPQLPTAQLSVYCAWGSACPLCEQLAAHPQCWTTAPNKGYTVGYYVLSTAPHLRGSPPIQLDFPSLDASVRTCARHARRVRDHADLSSLMRSSCSTAGGGSLVGQRGGGSSDLLHSLQPWFVRPHMFVTPVTAAYGVSPFEIFERMSYHSSSSSSNANHSIGAQRQHGGSSAAGVPLIVPVNNTSSLVEPERRDMLLNARTQVNPQETAAAAPTATGAVSRRGTTAGAAAEEQGHTLLQCADIAADAVDYLHRCANVIQRRLAYSRKQQNTLSRFEQACERYAAPTQVQAAGGLVAVGAQQQQSATKGASSSPLSATTSGGGGAGVQQESPSHTSTSPTSDNAISDAATASLSASRPIPATAAAATQPMHVGSAGAAGHGNDVHASSPLASRSGPLQLSSSADVRPRSTRYGRRQLPLHTATSPLTNTTLLFDSATPSVAVAAPADFDKHHSSNEAPLQQLSSNATVGGSSLLAGMKELLEGDRCLPVEVLLQYVLHHLIALSWGRRGVEVDTLVRLLERNLRRLPPLLANLQYVQQLRNAGFTSESAAAAVAALRCPAVGAMSTASGVDGTAVASPASSTVLTAVHTRLAASPISVSLVARPSPSNLTDAPDEASDTSPYSGGSRAAVAMVVTESEVQLLQAYEVLERLSLIEVLTPFATWPVRTVPTRLLLHTVVNEFCDVLYVDSSTRDVEADHWDLPVAAQ
jgi:hypothetical protein